MGGCCLTMWEWEGGGEEESFEVWGRKRKVKEVINTLPLSEVEIRGRDGVRVEKNIYSNFPLLFHEFEMKPG